jgi:hypothetical protein
MYSSPSVSWNTYQKYKVLADLDEYPRHVSPLKCGGLGTRLRPAAYLQYKTVMGLNRSKYSVLTDPDEHTPDTILSHVSVSVLVSIRQLKYISKI